jgi:hypothetical protein
MPASRGGQHSQLNSPYFNPISSISWLPRETGGPFGLPFLFPSRLGAVSVAEGFGAALVDQSHVDRLLAPLTVKVEVESNLLSCAQEFTGRQ